MRLLSRLYCIYFLHCKYAWQWIYKETVMKAQTDIAAVIITDRQWFFLYFSGSYGLWCQFLIFAWRCPQFTHIITPTWEKRTVEKCSSKTRLSLQRALVQFLKFFLNSYTLMLFRKHLKYKAIQKYLIVLTFFWFHCVIGNKQYKQFCPHGLKKLCAVIRIGWTTLATDDGWGESGLLKGYISH